MLNRGVFDIGGNLPNDPPITILNKTRKTLLVTLHLDKNDASWNRRAANRPLMTDAAAFYLKSVVVFVIVAAGSFAAEHLNRAAGIHFPDVRLLSLGCRSVQSKFAFLTRGQTLSKVLFAYP